jgi:hypothetical protein
MSGGLDSLLRRGRPIEFNKDAITVALYRPFDREALYFAAELNERRYQLPNLFTHFNVDQLRDIRHVRGRECSVCGANDGSPSRPALARNRANLVKKSPKTTSSTTSTASCTPPNIANATQPI